MEVMTGLRGLGLGGCIGVEEEGLSEWVVKRRRAAVSGLVLPSPGVSWGVERKRMEARRLWQPPRMVRSMKSSAVVNRFDEFVVG